MQFLRCNGGQSIVIPAIYCGKKKFLAGFFFLRLIRRPSRPRTWRGQDDNSNARSKYRSPLFERDGWTKLASAWSCFALHQPRLQREEDSEHFACREFVEEWCAFFANHEDDPDLLIRSFPFPSLSSPLLPNYNSRRSAVPHLLNTIS